MMNVKALATAFVFLTIPAFAGPPFPDSSPGVDGSGFILNSDVPQVLFGGKTPPHGFLVCAHQEIFVSDVAPLPGQSLDISGFELIPTISGDNPGGSIIACFRTPPGYGPIGPVWVEGGQGSLFQARMW